MADTTLMDKLVSLCKRRGFVFQSSEIYGGLGSVWDYGPLGVELKKNVKDRWWRAMVHARDDIEGLDAAILMHPKVWEASGHVAGFTDPLVDCKTCKARFRADKIEDAQCPQKPSKQPGEHTDLRAHRAAAVQPDVQDLHGPGRGAGGGGLPPARDGAGDLRQLPERAAAAPARRCPFGIAQIGKAFRNEITPGNFIFRTREFEQMEMQFFVKPGTDGEWFERWRGLRMGWHHALGLDPAQAPLAPARPGRAGPLRQGGLRHRVRVPLRLERDRGDPQPERLRPAAATSSTPARSSSTSTRPTNERFVPYIVETSAGADRVTLTVLVDAYREEEVEGETRVVLGFHPSVAPIKAAVFPLVKKDGMPEVATRIYHDLKQHAHRASTTTAGRSAGATAGWTRRARRSASRSTAQTLDRSHRDGPRPGCDEPGPGRRVDSLRAMA